MDYYESDVLDPENNRAGGDASEFFHFLKS
jgi:hypothetical protein